VYKEQDISRAVSEANSDLLMFAVFGLAVPVAFSYTTGLTGNAKLVLEEKFSLVVAICMLAIYALFMVFATVTHADQFVDAGDDDIGGSEDGDSERVLPSMELAVSVLVVSIALVAVASEFLIGSIEGFAEAAKLSPAFIAVVLLPVIGNAVEHMSAVLVALHNKMDMSVGIAIGSSVQIALFATPLLVVLSWLIPGDRLTLVFSNFNVIGLILSVLVVNSTLADAKSNVLEGAVLVACYVVLATAYFLMPGI
jgi:Ca2+:H+ antiporter